MKDSRQWFHTREISYMIYCSATDGKDRKTIYDWMPLEGDPTKEELAALKKEKLHERIERQRSLINSLVEKGVIKKFIPKKNNG